MTAVSLLIFCLFHDVLPWILTYKSNVKVVQQMSPFWPSNALKLKHFQYNCFILIHCFRKLHLSHNYSKYYQLYSLVFGRDSAVCEKVLMIQVYFFFSEKQVCPDCSSVCVWCWEQSSIIIINNHRRCENVFNCW